MTLSQAPDPVAAIALLGEPTRRRLYELVTERHAPVSRDEAGVALGISRELAAFHLDRLVEGGLLTVTYRRLGARKGPGGGRPTKLYARSPEDVAISLPARDYGRLATELADALVTLDRGTGLDAATEVARTRGEQEGADVRRSAGNRPSRKRLESALIGHLNEAGYEPEVDPKSHAIRLRNCPYRAIATTHRELTCGMNLAWAEGMVDRLGDPTLDAELVNVPGECCVRFEHRG
jgi:predicted ArsR family transcriptional regulator